jgi:hypothetical protein
MSSPLDALLNREFPVPPDDDSPLSAFLELSDGSLVSIGSASKTQIRATAKMHRAIAGRHAKQARRLEALARGEIGPS